MRHYSWQFTPLIHRAPFPTYRGQRPRAVTNATHKIQCQSAASGLPAVAGDAALDHFVAPAVACDDEAGQVATAETKPAKGDHDDELQQLTHRTSSGSLAIFAAIRRAAFFRRSRVFVDWSVPQADINFSASVQRTTFVLIKLHVIRPQGAWSHQDRGSHDLVLAHRSMPQACLMSKFMRPDAACHTTL